METDNIKTADPARSAVFLCVYEREKHTSIIKQRILCYLELLSEALVILVKKLVNLFHNLLHDIHP